LPARGQGTCALWLSDAGRLRADGAPDFTQPARVINDLPREFIIAMVNKLRHDFSGGGGDFVSQIC
jgi:hypothetical protein